MLYRRSSPTRPTLLLRIAGAGTLLGATACGGSTTAMGSVANPSPDSGAEAQAEMGSSSGGVMVMPPDAGDAQGPCSSGSGVCGSAPIPPDAGHPQGPGDGGFCCGSVVLPPDAGDAQGPCGGGFCGSVIQPDGGGD
jgi:hypothetical protein